nr:2'-5' RNA ligase family protein [Ramlibacter albus]
MNQSGLVVVIPEADARFGELRRKFDPQARLGVPAHVTILFPFMPPELVDSDVQRRLKLLFRRFSPFRCVLAEVQRFAETAYLAPVLAAPFVELTKAVAHAFPDYPPYGGAHPSIVPHLTIAQGDVRAADDAELELRADLERHGPVSAHCGTVTLLENSSGRWRAMHEFAFVGHQG